MDVTEFTPTEEQSDFIDDKVEEYLELFRTEAHMYGAEVTLVAFLEAAAFLQDHFIARPN